MSPSNGNDEPRVPRNLARARRVGLAIVLVGLGGFVLWAATARLEGAVTARGQVTTTASLKAVEHRDGGVVKRIAFAAGDRVEKGQVLVELDATKLESRLGAVRGRFATARARHDRLVAEQTGKAKVAAQPLPDDASQALQTAYREALKTQRNVFQRREAALANEIAQSRERAQALRARLAGLDEQIAARRDSLALLRERVADVKRLRRQDLAKAEELREARREVLETEAKIADLQGQQKQTRVKLAETELKIAQARADRQVKVAEQLSKVRQRLHDLRERRRALSQQLQRTTIRAPASGIVVDKQLHTEGGVLEAGERIAKIVPAGQDLVIDARVRPRDIDSVRVGQSADIRLTAFSYRRTPVVSGEVVHVSADRLEPERKDGRPYYRARIALERSSLEQALPADAKLLPGMPAQAMIVTEPRTVMAYLLKPLTDALARSFREP